MSHLQSIERACRSKIPDLLICVREDDTASYCKIELKDILFTLWQSCKNLNTFAPLKDGKLQFETWKDTIDDSTTCWYDLTKSPYDQSEETLKFLAENLTK